MLRVWLKYYWGDQMIRIHLSRLLGERRWTQIQLSRATGIRAATITAIATARGERGQREHLDRICEALDCDLSDLMEYVPNIQKKTGHDLIVEEHGNRRKQP